MHLDDYDDLVKIQPGDGPTPKELGLRIANFRAEGGLSINAVASRAGISRGLFSEIERGIRNPSYNTLVSIARALNIHVGSLFGGEPENVHGPVRAGARRTLTMGDGPVYEMLTPSVRGRLIAYVSYLPPHWSNEDQPLRHPGEEIAHVIDGEVLISVDDEPYVLTVGDSLTWDAAKPHWCRNTTSEVAKILYSMTPPNF
jgi:transcriptional regulator with XRE-family HTH domain